MSNSPFVLIIDDRFDERVRGLRRQLRQKRIDAKALLPEDVNLADLKKADLVLVDHDLSDWRERAGSPLSRYPADGLALCTVLRRHLAKVDGLSPTAFAIYTGQIQDLATPLPPENRCHVLAGLNNLEWVFSKDDPDVADQVASLAHAVQSLPSVGRSSSGTVSIDGWLNIQSSSSLAPRLREEVGYCHPPVHELTEWSHGIALLRWLAQRILPYPCFLWDSRRVASRLRITHASFMAALSAKKLDKALSPFRYRGALGGFLGRRWWRGGIEHWLWTVTRGKSVLPEAVREAVKRFGGSTVRPSVADEPVTCIDENYQLVADPVAADSAVPVQPDDWPIYAEKPWMEIEMVKGSSKLKALVIGEHGRRL